MDTSERDFESAIERLLLAGGPDDPGASGPALHEAAPPYGAFASGGYRRRASDAYDRALCLIREDTLAFILGTQPKEWRKFEAPYGAEAKDRFFTRLAQEVQQRGTLDVLRKGLKANGCRFKLAYFQPASGLNPDLHALYESNVLAVVRQLHFSPRDEKSLDVAIFLNGLPIFTAELKNPLSGQNVQDAILQYRQDRDPREPLFAFGRCLAHFAVDPDLAYMTTHLQGPRTRFLPFNQGHNGGAGNPPSWRGFATAYLWERTFSRESVLDLVQHFIHEVQEENDEGRKTGKRTLIFPRYHQLDAVRRLVADARAVGPGHRYLIQHSAGSGKSNSIAWLAHQLSVLHDVRDRRVFDSIIVVTDRRVLDRQLQRTVLQFEQTLGVVENIDTTSRQLRQALEDGKTIIVTTLQKFPVIVGQIQALPGQRFAVIVDEAHSSQSGETTKGLKEVLMAPSLEEAEAADTTDGDDVEDRVTAETRARGRLPNVSYFAFTATPKAKTLELFGHQRENGGFAPFSDYTMRQAIEESFILDVLQNYTPYKTYWNLLKKIEADPRYDRARATALLVSFVSLSEHAIAKKVAIMVDHFAGQVAHQITGRAKAMIVTRSRLHAVRYRLAVDRYLAEKGHPWKALVAFSGTVQDVSTGFDYTEAQMNGFPEARTAKTFERDEYRLLIVANKFQTGFDQPLLHTMYVDKKLGGVNAVQTLSRLNRVHPDKSETMVLDFANEADEIQQAFEPYYDVTSLAKATDPNLLYDYQTRLESFHLYTEEDVNRFASFYFDPKATQDKLHAALAPVVARYKGATDQERADFRGQLTDYVNLYSFLSQVIPFTDNDLEKLYQFARLLRRKLPISRDRLPLEVQQSIDIESYRVQQTGKQAIPLQRGSPPIEPIGGKVTYVLTPEEMEPLSQIIKRLNEHFGTDFTAVDRVSIRELEERLAQHDHLATVVRVNTTENARLTFDHVVNDVLQTMIDGHFKFYKQVNDDPRFARFFLDWLFDRYRGRLTPD